MAEKDDCAGTRHRGLSGLVAARENSAGRLPAGRMGRRVRVARGWRPPYPPLGTRVVRGTLGYAAVFGGVAVLLQFFTPFPVLSWLEKLVS